MRFVGWLNLGVTIARPSQQPLSRENLISRFESPLLLDSLRGFSQIVFLTVSVSMTLSPEPPPPAPLSVTAIIPH